MKKIRTILTVMLMLSLLCSCSVLYKEHGHSFGDWITERNATCTQSGLIVRYCDCGKKQSQETSKTEHDYNGKNVCKNCGHVKGVNEPEITKVTPYQRDNPTKTPINEPTPTPQENIGMLPIQWENKRFYFKQGCSADWMFTEVDAQDKYKIDETSGLVCVLAPIDGAALTEAELETAKKDVTSPKTSGKTPVDGVEYCVYHINAKESGMISFQTDTAEIVSYVMDPENKMFAFNLINNRGEARTAFTQTGEAKLFTAKYSKVQFNQIDYTFTKDGEDMKGSYFLVMKDVEYFIVTYEAKAALYDQYFKSFIEIIGDWNKVGWKNKSY